MCHLPRRGVSVNNPSWQIGHIQAGVFWLRGSQQEPCSPQMLFVAVSEPTRLSLCWSLGPSSFQRPAPFSGCGFAPLKLQQNQKAGRVRHVWVPVGSAW